MDYAFVMTLLTVLRELKDMNGLIGTRQQMGNQSQAFQLP
jgi:hypothetical protein